MKKITDFIVNHCYAVFAVMLVFAGVSAFLATKVNINHDLMAYMPADSETAQGLDIMDTEFSDVATADYMMMFENLTAPQELEIQSYLEQVAGVKSVAHEQNNEYIRELDGVTYYLYDITVNGEADGADAKRAYDEIQNHFREAEFVFYDKGDVKDSNGEVLNIMVILIAVGSALVVIWLMSDSNIEPLLYLAAILLAVIINKGTNIIFPSVSHVTDSICAILQMALSMDYSIMLATRYRQERAKESDKFIAMKTALHDSFSSISASSLTTIVGLIVLIFMSFTIGRDMGLVLSKGVLLSLVSIFTTLPCMLLACDKFIQKSKKRAPRIKLDSLGRFAHFIRLAAVPIFAVIFVAAAFLKGNVAIDYTSAANDKIKDIFDEKNQIAVIYDNQNESSIADLCRDYDGRADTAEVLCYSNTIGEPETVGQLSTKAADLGTDLDVADYLLRIIYYHYYHPAEDYELTLADFTDFILDDVLMDDNFADDITAAMRRDVARLADFVTDRRYTEQSIDYLATLLDMDESSLTDILVLYGARVSDSKLGRETSATSLTLPEFVDFVQNSVLKNSTYAQAISTDSRIQLAKLARFADAQALQAPATAEQIAARFGIDGSSVEDIMNYATFLAATPDFTAAERAQLLAIISSAELTSRFQLAYHAYQTAGDSAIFALADPAVIESVLNFSAHPELLSASPMTAVQFADFVLDHASDPMIASQLDSSAVSDLELARFVMQQVIANTKFSYPALAQTFNLDAEQLRLLYSLYNIEFQDQAPMLAPRDLLNFLYSDILPSSDYNAGMLPSQQSKLTTLYSLMQNAEQRTSYTSQSIYNALSPLSDNLDSNLVDLIYIYHGSKFDFNELSTLTLEQFVNYLSDDILNDSRFAGRISDGQRAQIVSARADIADAKALLVGEDYSRAIIQTTLPEEGEDTFAFIESLHQRFSDEQMTAYLVGNSSMAYEMSQTFDGEMNFITILTMAAIFIVVAFTFKSATVPLIMVMLIQSAVWATMAILSFTGASVYFIALIIVQAILMGATIDYAILFASYYLEHRHQGINVKQALIESYNKSIHAILTSALVLILVTFIVGNFSSASAIASKICITISQGTACSVLLILIILPAVLAACDKILVRHKAERITSGDFSGK